MIRAEEMKEEMTDEEMSNREIRTRQREWRKQGTGYERTVIDKNRENKAVVLPDLTEPFQGKHKESWEWQENTACGRNRLKAIFV